MATFRVCFRVEQTLNGSIEVEAADADEARALFEARGRWSSKRSAEMNERADEIDERRRNAKLDLDESEDSITEVQDAHGKTVWLESAEA